ncbi:hypothetical protein EJ06DRAFT_521305 [Trichodelitschia bisporula]|uniref:Gem-associated protein 5 TPR domain-containing protein n=1 Tax=Trichodelitschia bisporula TaxID=703511 RepID=A0A6G1HZT5_9PEZI|nr:hypothetical protein EJ06DRAFT_521305 [Trichodelitschia bisporula]
MSIASRSSHASRGSRHSSRSNRSLPPPAPSLTPSSDAVFEACAATASFFLYAQRNVIICLHVDTLAIERRFERHRDNVLWITVDNVSDKGNGRLVVSYDASQTTIVWDLFSGDEVARFASYEELRVAVWMKNSNLAFGNSQGNVILFEPTTSEHISARTIFDPITALAPSTDCRTFAIGYMNGSILIAHIQPQFTILHTLSTNRSPSPINKLAWHGSSSKQKSDMLAVQTQDGDLRVWSIPKVPNGDQPTIIRVLSRHETDRLSGPCWFGWSKMGRIVQYSEGMTFVWDVRTKRVTYESVPTIDGIVGVANFGPTATLFTMGRNHTVQQYDLNPSSRPTLVQNVQHVPSKLPPSPPISDGDQRKVSRYVTADHSIGAQGALPSSLPLYLEVESSEGEATMSPLQRIAREMDQLDESRDTVGPLSPSNSSKASTTSRSSRGGGQRHRLPQASPKPLLTSKDRPASPLSNSANSASTATTFSLGSTQPALPGANRAAARESISTRSLLSTSTSKSKGSRLRQEVMRSPESPHLPTIVDLFPYTRARLSEVPFRPPQYDERRQTPDQLRAQMLEVVFGWSNDIEALIRDELERFPPGSTGSVLLCKWLGDLSSEMVASMISNQSPTSSNWMLLALSSMGQGSQKKVGDAFVSRLLESGDIHPAAAILIGLGEYNDAVEVYVSRKYYMEAVLLACLVFPQDYQRHSHLLRKWGEVAIQKHQPELAVRCFSCTGLESTEPWFSPAAQDAVYVAQQRALAPDQSQPSPRLARLHPSAAGLKLVTDFTKPAIEPKSALDDKTPMVYGITPIDTALSPSGVQHLRPFRRGDPESASRTATPGGFARRRLPSQSAIDRIRGGTELNTPIAEDVDVNEPMTAVKEKVWHDRDNFRMRSTSVGQGSQISSSTLSATLSATSYRRTGGGLPSPNPQLIQRLADSHHRNGSRERKPEGLYLHMDDVVTVDSTLPSASTVSYSGLRGASPTSISVTRDQAISPMSDRRAASAMKSSKAKSIDQYISSLEEANYHQKTKRSASKTREPSREGRTTSRTSHRAPSAGRAQGTRYVKPAKRSPSSPVSMSPDDPALQTSSTFDDERYYRLASPVEPLSAHPREREPLSARPHDSHAKDLASVTSRKSSKTRRGESADRAGRMRSKSRPGGERAPSRPRSPDEDIRSERRGRSKARQEGEREPSPVKRVLTIDTSTSVPVRPRERSENRVRSRSRDRSRSARRPVRDPSPADSHVTSGSRRKASRSRMPKLQTNFSDPTIMTKKALAAKELEERRLSLARRPSAPAIIHPDELSVPRSAIDRLPTSPGGFAASPMGGMPSEAEQIRGNPNDLRKLATAQSGAIPKAAPMGLPATPRAMRHPTYTFDVTAATPDVPSVPPIPETSIRHSTEHFQSPVVQGETDDNFMLPAVTFVPRSASAPPEKTVPRKATDGKAHGHGRKLSSSVTVILPQAGASVLPMSIDEALHGSGANVIHVASPGGNAQPLPAVVPELQHLNMPPPPPPPPPPPSNLSAHLSVIDPENAPPTDTSRTVSPTAEMPSLSSSPSQNRRGRNSMSENVGLKLRSVRDRIRDRSASRNRTMNISPPIPSYTPSAPYESLVGVQEASQGGAAPPPPPPPPVPYESLAQPGIEPLPQTTFGGYKKETRAQALAHGETLAAERYTPAPSSSSASPAPYESMASLGGVGYGGPSPQPQQQVGGVPRDTTYAGYRTPKEIAAQMAAAAERQQQVEEQIQLAKAGFAGYRHPKEVRANMPPESYGAGRGGEGEMF